MDTGDVKAMQAMSRKNVRARRVSFQDQGNDSTNLEHQPEERTQLPSYYFSETCYNCQAKVAGIES